MNIDELIPISNYANLHNKDTSTIRKLLISNKIHGFKIGNSWLISKYEPYPLDSRLNEGKYINARKKARFLNKYPKLSKQIKQMSKELVSLYKTNLYEIILYGSYARNEESYNSDIDIALVLYDVPSEHDHELQHSIVAKYWEVANEIISVQDIHYSDIYCSNPTPYYKNIKKDGITIWKKK